MINISTGAVGVEGGTGIFFYRELRKSGTETDYEYEKVEEYFKAGIWSVPDFLSSP